MLYMLCGCSFLRVGLQTHTAACFKPIFVKGCTHVSNIWWHHVAAVSVPVVVFDEFHQLLLCVRFPWDEHWIIHERFIEIHVIELHLQSLGNL